jgi:hypothetical protein
MLLFGKMFLALQNFFIFCIMKVFSGAIQSAKFEHMKMKVLNREI